VCFLCLSVCISVYFLSICVYVLFCVCVCVSESVC